MALTIVQAGMGGTGSTTASSTGTGAAVLATQPVFPSTIGVGGATASTSGAGITFPATQSASSDANCLDDYEEGTWTPSFVNFSGTTGWTFSYAAYVKIGRTVFINCQITPGAGTISCTANSGLITGLPFVGTGANSPVPWATNYIDTLGTGVIYGSSGVYAPTLSVTNAKTIFFAGSYITTA